ncbi:hypothetical protein BGW39_000178 [Mortierella sp. 14UC]|nr:hypothetical protein BGW39_000178 [Mortierella sp. 14UC]
MCGFGEKDRRPVDPPPIVQLLLDEQHDQHPARRAHRSAIAAALAAASSSGKKGGVAGKKKGGVKAGKAKGWRNKKSGAGQEEDVDGEESAAHGDNEEEEEDADETYQQVESDADEGDKKSGRSTSAGRALRGGKNVRHEHGPGSTSSPSLGKHGRSTNTKSDQSNSHSDQDSHSDHSDNDDNDDAHDGGDLDEQDPLFVLHVSLWSHDGTEVRNMIATPGQSDPPKLTRILMGSLVVSPILLNNPEGVPGWYFSFPDLSIRTEGTYTLKFSLMRFGSFDFSSSEDGQASMLVAEEISEPFQVFSAKKFPGMTESTELSKAFAKQGLKIPIRNDLRVRKADRE